MVDKAVEILESHNAEYALLHCNSTYPAPHNELNLNIIPSMIESKKIINKSIVSSNFVGSLELAKNGFIEVKQNNVFGNIFIKIRQ